MTREDLVEILTESKDWTVDRYGHFRGRPNIYGRYTKKGIVVVETTPVREYRIKMQPKACRFERRMRVNTKLEWQRIESCYYGKVTYQDYILKIGKIELLMVF